MTDATEPKRLYSGEQMTIAKNINGYLLDADDVFVESRNKPVCNLLKLMPNASLYHFGVLTSNVHMAWMRAVAGRLKSDYRYSKDIVYNN